MSRVPVIGLGNKGSELHVSYTQVSSTGEGGSVEEVGMSGACSKDREDFL